MKKTLKKNSFIQGTMIVSICLILIKILGALYVIPFKSIIGDKGGTLYSYAYNIYSLFLNISTAGIPVAMSMIISEYLALEMYDAKEKSKKVATKMITVLSIGSFIIAFLGAPLLAKFLLGNVDTATGINEVAVVIRAVSFCLLIIPFLSVIRGYLQGHKIIAPSAFSQLLEQIVRIVIVLGGAYVSIKVLALGEVTGVSIALMGAFFGGLVAYLYLYFKIKMNQEVFPKGTSEDNVKEKDIIKKILSYSIPIITIAIINDIYTLVDIKLIVQGLNLVGYEVEDAKAISSIVATWAPKICTLILAISTALTTNIIPHITTSYTQNDQKGVIHGINQSINTMLIVGVPMTIMLMFLSKEAYSVFYGSSSYGSLILKASAVSHLVFGVWSVLNSALQSMKKFKLIYMNSLLGLFVNAMLDIPLILWFTKLGIPAYIATVVATIIGYILSIIIVFSDLKKEMNFHFEETRNLIGKIVLPSAMIGVLLFLSTHFITIEGGRITSLIVIALNGGISSLIYLVMVYRNKALEDALGKDFIEGMKRRLKLSKGE